MRVGGVTRMACSVKETGARAGESHPTAALTVILAGELIEVCELEVTPPPDPT